MQAGREHRTSSRQALVSLGISENVLNLSRLPSLLHYITAGGSERTDTWGLPNVLFLQLYLVGNIRLIENVVIANMNMHHYPRSTHYSQLNK